MKPTEYVFRIDAFTPDTLPMGRLAEYLAALAKLLGHAENTHFVRVEEGSAKLIHKVEAVDAPKVEARLRSVRMGDAQKDAFKAYKALEELLLNDNALGELVQTDTGEVVIPFQGRNRPKVLNFPPFRQNTSIDGQVVSIGGRDATAHATLQDGEIFHTNVVMNRAAARELAKLLYGPTLRLFGNGRFERQADGVWKMHDFKVDRYEILSDQGVGAILQAIRDIPNNKLIDKEIYHDLSRLENDGDS